MPEICPFCDETVPNLPHHLTECAEAQAWGDDSPKPYDTPHKEPPWHTLLRSEDREPVEGDWADRKPGLLGEVGKDPDLNPKSENEGTRPEWCSESKGGGDGE